MQSTATRPRPRPQSPARKLDWTFHRQYELYRDRSRTTGRLALGSVALAALLLFRVVTPFHDLSLSIAKQETAIAALEDSRVEASEREARLASAARVFREVDALLAGKPWHDLAADLERTVVRLDESYRRLVETDLDEVLKAFEQMPDVPVMVGEAPRPDVRTREAAFQWVEPPKPPLTPRDEREETPPALSEDQARAVEEYEEARKRLGELGLAPPAAAAVPEAAEVGVPREPTVTIIEALEAMRVDPTRMAELGSFRERDQFLYETLKARVAQEADGTVEALLQIAENHVLTPLEAEAGAERGPGERPLARLERALGEWAEPYRANSGWHETLHMRPAVARELADSFEGVLARVAPQVEGESAALDASWKEAQTHSRDLGEELVAAIQNRDRLFEASADILPVWIAEFLSTAEVVQVFPALLVAFLLLVGVAAWSARRHFLAFQTVVTGPREQAELRAASSVWTLVRRGPLRTTGTLFVYLACTATLWLAFEQGIQLVTAWASLPGSHPWPATLRLTEAAPWFGRAAFLAAGGGVLLTLFVEETPARMPRPA